MNIDNLKERVKRKYGEIAENVSKGASYCSNGSRGSCDAITSNLYGAGES